MCICGSERKDTEGNRVVHRAVDQGAKLVLNEMPVKCGKLLTRRFGVRAVSGDDSSKSKIINCIDSVKLY